MDERKYNCLIEMKENVKKDKILLFSAKFSLVEEQGLEKRKFRKLFGKGRRRRKMSRIGFKISQKLFKEVQKVVQKLFECCVK